MNITRFIALRFKILGYLAAFTLGWVSMGAWVVVVLKAPAVAQSVIAKVGML